jgi:hypothetical protein
LLLCWRCQYGVWRRCRGDMRLVELKNNFWW